MKRILILIIGLIGVAYGQSSPTSAKTRFVNGIYLGTKLDSYFNAADSNAIYWRADSALMAKYKGAARRVVFSGELGSYIPYSDTTSLFSQVVRTFGTQTVGGNKTFSNTLATSSGVGIISGGATFPYSPSATRGVIHITGSTDRFLSFGSDFYLYSASSLSQLNSAPNLDFFIGGGSRARILAANGNFLINKTSDNLLDKFQVSGNGNFSDTLKTNVGVISSVTSSLLKTNGSGVVSAAVAGDITSLISGTYVDLTTNQTIGGNKTFTNAIAVGGTNPSTLTGDAGSYPRWQFTVDAKTWEHGYRGGTTAYEIREDGTTRFSIANGGAISTTGSINGTSLSMSGIGLFNGAVDDGTNKLIVNGGVKGTKATFTSQTNPSGYFDQTYAATGDPSTAIRTNLNTSAGGAYIAGYDGDAQFSWNREFVNGSSNVARAANAGYLDFSSSGINLYFNTGLTANATYTPTSRLAISTTGAATFSSSVGATSFTVSSRTTLGAAYVADNASSGNNIGIGFNTAGVISTDGNGSYSSRDLGTTSNRWAAINATTGNFSSSVTASSFVKSGGTSSQALIADGSVQTLTSGTYTPTITNTTNITSTTARTTTYTRVGNTVTVSGWVTITTTSNEVATEIGVSLPIASAFTAAYDLSGSGLYEISTTSYTQFTVKPDTTNDRAKIVFYPFGGSGTAVETQFSFQYQVL